MKYRKLGNTDLVVSEVSLGCSGFWGNRRFPEQYASAIIYEAFERGVNFFDTGHNYCNYNAEPRLGRAVKQLLSNCDRSQLVISSKAGTVDRSLLHATRGNSGKITPDDMEKFCSQSIKNLNCDYLDIFQLRGLEEATEPILERLVSMKKKGMFRYLGVNTHRESEMHTIAMQPEFFDMVLVDYNVLQLDRKPTIDMLNKAGIGIVAGTVLCQGHILHGKIGSIRSISDLWYLARAVLKPGSRNLGKNSKHMRETLASIPECSSAQAAFQFILEDKAIASCTFGTTRISNLIEVIESSEKELSEKSRLAIHNSFNLLHSKISL